MPVCFQLFDKEKNEATSFSKIDKELCSFLGAPVDPVRYVLGWYDSIGFRLACGKSFEQIKAEFAGYVAEAGTNVNFYKNLLRVVEWLETRYSPNSWREIGRA